VISIEFQFISEDSDEEGFFEQYEVEAFARDVQVEDFEVVVVDSDGKYVEPTSEMYLEARRRLLSEVMG
jgi:hypothetical protein